jgi:hypothetical protein
MEVSLAGGDPTIDRALAEALRAQATFVSAAVGTPPREDEEDDIEH